jgi:hypothetical protein
VNFMACLVSSAFLYACCSTPNIHKLIVSLSLRKALNCICIVIECSHHSEEGNNRVEKENKVV